MRKVLFFIVLVILSWEASMAQTILHKIAIGSNLDQDGSQRIMDLIARRQPDAFISLGNIINDGGENTLELREKYGALSEWQGLKKLRQSAKFFATWDDHEFGQSQGGRHNPMKIDTKELFLDFAGDPENSLRRTHEGIYNSYSYGLANSRVQIILLDTRTFRDNLLPYQGDRRDDPRYFYPLQYSAYNTADSTLLGEEQWAWLEMQLMEPAMVHLIVSPIPFCAEYNGMESWADFPNEQDRLFKLIDKTRALGVTFLSSHSGYSEISRLKKGIRYPIYDFTCAGMNTQKFFPTPNVNRIEGPVMEPNFGLLTFDWAQDKMTMTVECIDANNNTRFEYVVKLLELVPNRE